MNLNIYTFRDSGIWGSGNLGIWKFVNLEFVSLGISESGNLGIWGSGDLGVWELRNLEIQESGDP